MSKIAVVHYLGATLRSRSVVASLLADLTEQGHEVSLLDISLFNTVNQDFPPRWIASALGHKVFAQRFEEICTELGVTRYRLQSPGKTSLKPPVERWNECLQAIDSELLTYFRISTLSNESSAIRSMRTLLTKNALASFAAISQWLDSHNPDEVIVPNGRTSRQKMARVAAETRGIPVRFYENGRARKDSYYLGTTQPHDRIASQEEVGSLTAHLSKTAIRELAEGWLRQRTERGSGTNTFSRSWAVVEPRTSIPEKPRAVFFPSSTDEFLAFGPMWNVDQWDNQFQAFDLIMSILEARGCDLILRLHPNLRDKSRSYFRETAKGIKWLQDRHPSLSVHWHNSPVNSYDLVNSADYVIVERSTIGLEANLMGKPVWVNQAAQWDMVADVRQALAESQISEDFLTPWPVDPSGAQRFVAYWMIQEHPLKYSWREWATWDADAAPIGLRFATIFTTNPLLHKVQLVKNFVTAWMNDRFTPPKRSNEVG